MYTAGNIIYFTPFYFSDGSSATKYFLVLKNIDNVAIIASLPTSQDYIPNFIPQQHGCINDRENMVSCYFFKGGRIITENDWGFPIDTYIYGETIKDLPIHYLNSLYAIEDVDYKIIGKLTESEYRAIIMCLKMSPTLKRGIKKKL